VNRHDRINNKVRLLAVEALASGTDAAWSRPWAVARTPEGCKPAPDNAVLGDRSGENRTPFLWFRYQWERALGCEKQAGVTYHRIHRQGNCQDDQPEPNRGDDMAKKKATRKCGECRRAGHTKTTCPKLKRKGRKTRKPAKNTTPKRVTREQHAERLTDVLSAGLNVYMAKAARKPGEKLVAEIVAGFGVTTLFEIHGAAEATELLADIVRAAKQHLDDLDDEDDDWDDQDDEEPDDDDDDDDGGALFSESWAADIPDAILKRLNGAGARIFGG
jgi:hypothetical protein